MNSSADSKFPVVLFNDKKYISSLLTLRLRQFAWKLISANHDIIVIFVS